MNVHEWHRRGLEPSFATIELWIDDQLGYLGAEDEACFAVTLSDEKSAKGFAVRILIATDKGLFDLTWERPEAVADRRLASRHYRWEDVRGTHLVSETRLNPETLTHGQPHWRLEIDEPEVSIDDHTEGSAMLEFWKACSASLDKVSG